MPFWTIKRTLFVKPNVVFLFLREKQRHRFSHNEAQMKASPSLIDFSRFAHTIP